MLLLACYSPTPEAPPLDAVDQVGRYAAGVGHLALRADADCDEETTTVTVETRGDDGEWEEAEDVEVDWDGADALDVVLVADNSGSVSAWDAVIAEAVGGYGEQILSGADNRAGLVRVSTEASTLAPLAADGAAWATAVDALGVRNGWTALWDGVRLAHEVHAAAEQVRASADLSACVGEAHRAVVVYTDGQDNNSADEHPTSYDGDGVDTTLAELGSQQVAGIQPPIFTIGVGEGVDEAALGALAEGSGGAYLPIDALDELPDALGATEASLASEIPVCWVAPDCADTEVRITVEVGGESWTQSFSLPDDLCVDDEGGGCTLTQGYWKNHEEAWPVDELVLGGRSYDRDTLLELLDSSTRGDRSLQLSHQLIAARLNEARGADPSALGSTLDDADAWLAAHDDGDGLPFGTKAWDGADAYESDLDDFNNGLLGPGHCD